MFSSEGGGRNRRRRMWCVCVFATAHCGSQRTPLGPEVPVLRSMYLLTTTHTNIWNKNKINLCFKDMIRMALKVFFKCKLNCDQSELILLN